MGQIASAARFYDYCACAVPDLAGPKQCLWLASVLHALVKYASCYPESSEGKGTLVHGLKRRKLVLPSSDRVHRRRRGRQRRLGHDRCRGSSGRRRRRQSIFTKFRGVYAMQRQSRSLGDELWRSEQCQNDGHFVASDGRRTSINCRHICQLAVER